MLSLNHLLFLYNPSLEMRALLSVCLISSEEVLSEQLQELLSTLLLQWQTIEIRRRHPYDSILYFWLSLAQSPPPLNTHNACSSIINRLALSARYAERMNPLGHPCISHEKSIEKSQRKCSKSSET